MMKHFIYTLLFCCIITTTVSAQTTTSFLTLGEGNSTGDGTFIGMSSYSTQPCNTKSFALEHHFYGYINSSINFFRGGSATGGFLTFNTNDNNERMRIDPSGNVGIGTIIPQNKLHVVEESQTEFYGTDNGIPISNMVLDGSDNGRVVGKGPSLTFRMPANADGSNSWAQARILASPDNTNSGDARGRLYLQVRDLYNPGVGGSWNWRTGLMIAANGNTGIGTTNPAYKLDVLGTIRAKEVLVNLDGGADFVFEKDYKLPTIEHVANYVQENKHLPDIPSANEMVKNGVSMGDMQVKLLQKVEELTLYAIEMKKEINMLKEENKRIRTQLEQK